MDFDWRFYLFMNPDLRDNGIQDQHSATNHWNLYGKNENRFGIPVDVARFDFAYYRNTYSDIKHIVSKRELLIHWYTHGKKEGRWCHGPKQIIKSDTRVSLSSIEHEHENMSTVESFVFSVINGLISYCSDKTLWIDKAVEIKPITLRIITRTSRRPNSFSLCRYSVLRQYKNLPTACTCFHHIIYDNPFDEYYISGDYIQKVSKENSENYEFPYNDYINSAIQKDKLNDEIVDWNIVLDDDDMFIDAYAIRKIIDTICHKNYNPDSIIMWKTQMSEEKILPSEYTKQHILKTKKVPSCSFAFHQKWTKHGYRWKPVRGGDFAFLSKLLNHNDIQIASIDEVLTSLQNGAGWGKCMDIPMLPLRTHSLSTLNLYVHDTVNNNDDSENNENKTNKISCFFSPFFDRVIVLNLERRSDRWDNFVLRSKKENITSSERFIGIDGKHDRECIQLWKEYNSILRSPPCIPSIGSLAILLSTKNIIQYSAKENDKHIMMFQDDVLFCKNFQQKCSIFLEFFTTYMKNWSLIYLGCTQHTWPSDRIITPITSEIGFYYPQGTADGAFAVAINRTRYSELLELIGTTQLPLDSGPMRTLQRRYPDQCVCAWPYLVIADVTDSDCRDSRSQEFMAHKVEWNLDDFETI